MQRNRSYINNQIEIMELNNSITGIVNSLDGFNSSVEMTEDTISGYKYRGKIIQPIQNNTK